MQLVDIVTQKFGDMDVDQLKMVIMALSPCREGVEWLNSQSDTRAMIEAAPRKYLTWFSKPFLSGADLRGAYMHGADLSDANLYGAKYDRATNLYEAFVDLSKS